MFGRAFGRVSCQTSGRTLVCGARGVSGAETKAFDRGGPVWPPRSNVTNDRLGGVLGGLCPAKIRGVWLQPKPIFCFLKRKKYKSNPDQIVTFRS